MEPKMFVDLIGHIAWPVTMAIVVIIFHNQIKEFIHNIKDVKVGDLSLKLDIMTDKIESVEAATKNLSIDLYRVTGDALQVREEIWSYIAEVLRKASPHTRYEMAEELNKYHLSRLGVLVSEVKSMLWSLGYYNAEGTDGFNEDVTDVFVQAIFDFQDAQQLDYSDGIVGPSSLAILKRSVAEKNRAQQENPADS